MHNYSCLNQLAIFPKCSILDVWQSSDYASNYTPRYKIVIILRLEYIKSLYYLLSKHDLPLLTSWKVWVFIICNNAAWFFCFGNLETLLKMTIPEK